MRGARPAGYGGAWVLPTALSRELGVTPEMLVAAAQQVSRDQSLLPSSTDRGSCFTPIRGDAGGVAHLVVKHQRRSPAGVAASPGGAGARGGRERALPARPR